MHDSSGGHFGVGLIVGYFGSMRGHFGGDWMRGNFGNDSILNDFGSMCCHFGGLRFARYVGSAVLEVQLSISRRLFSALPVGGTVLLWL